MQKYKFRARDFKGHTYYGDLLHVEGEIFIRQGHDKPTVKVDPASVALLVGYIPEGKFGVREVYEGDEIFTDDDQTAFAAVTRFVKTELSGEIDFLEFAKKYRWRLKN